MAKTTATNVAQKKSNKKMLKWVLIGANIVLIFSLIATTGYFFSKYDNLKAEQRMTQDQKNDKLVSEVNKVYDLPKEEKPVVALVADEQQFKKEYQVFTTAKKDDYLLLYEKAGLAVLYRPNDKKVIATAPLSIKKQLSIALIGPEDQTLTVEKTLQDKVAKDVTISSKTVGVTAYPQTIVIDVSGKQASAASQLATIVGGTVGQLPAGEKAPDGADIVVVVATPPQPAP